MGIFLPDSKNANGLFTEVAKVDSTMKKKMGGYFKELKQMGYVADAMQAQATRAVFAHSRQMAELDETKVKNAHRQLKKAREMLQRAQHEMLNAVDHVSGVVESLSEDE